MSERPVTARDIRRLVNLALDGVSPGCEVEVEHGGIRVRVKRDAPGESVSVSSDDDALATVRRQLGLARNA